MACKCSTWGWGWGRVGAPSRANLNTIPRRQALPANLYGNQPERGCIALDEGQVSSESARWQVAATVTVEEMRRLGSGTVTPWPWGRILGQLEGE